jgi:hypothetical protein
MPGRSSRESSTAIQQARSRPDLPCFSFDRHGETI